MTECIRKLNFPVWINNFLLTIISLWKLSIKSKGKEILEKEIKRGILQGDKLSLLLFVLCHDPLSRRLNATYPKVGIPLDDLSYATNHLLFIEYLKLFSENEVTAKLLLDETKDLFSTVGLEMNYNKTATNSFTCRGEAVLLDDLTGYKYLGITETCQSKISPQTLEKIK